VALLLTGDLAREVDGLRRACGDGALGRVPPHLTLVPPVNVRADDLPHALAVLRRAAAQVRPFTLRLGPPATFLPATPTLHLAVGGAGSAPQVLRELRDGVFRPPLERSLSFGFVPHVTLADEMEPDRIAGALVALRDFVAELHVERVHLLEESRGDDGHRRWDPIADAPLAPAVVVGRGGVQLDLAVSRLLDPEAAAFEARVVDAVTGTEAGSSEPVGSGADRGGQSVVVVARRGGAVVGVARGWAGTPESELTSVIVDPAHRRQGIARQLVAAFDHAAHVAS
jgi:2'-5' RNA ligase